MSDWVSWIIFFDRDIVLIGSTSVRLYFSTGKTLFIYQSRDDWSIICVLFAATVLEKHLKIKVCVRNSGLFCILCCFTEKYEYLVVLGLSKIHTFLSKKFLWDGRNVKDFILSSNSNCFWKYISHKNEPNQPNWQYIIYSWNFWKWKTPKNVPLNVKAILFGINAKSQSFDW